MDIIKNKLLDSKKLIDYFYEYFDKLKPLLEDKYIDENKHVDKIINSFPKQSKDIETYLDEIFTIIKTNNFEKITYGIFELYNKLQNFYLSIDFLMNLFNQSYMHSENMDLSALSQTYKLETADFLTKLTISYNSFKKTFVVDEQDIIQYFSKIITDIIHIEDFDIIKKSINYIQQCFYNNKNTVKLYAAIIQNLLDYTYENKETRPVTFYLLDIIEQNKDFFISGNIENQFSKNINSDIHYKNPLLKRFRLQYSGPSKLLNEILGDTIKNHDDLKKLCKTKHVGCIIMYHVTYTPIEHQLSKLLGKTDRSSVLPGITEKNIKDSQIIDYLSDKSVKWKFTYDIIGDKESDNFYVLETLDGKKYRALVPWLDINSGNILLGRYRIQNLLNYLTNDNKPDRVSNYHAIAQNKAIPHMFLSRPLELDFMEEQSKAVDTQIIRNDLYHTLTNAVGEIIDTTFAKGKNITSMIQVNQIIHDEIIRDLFTNTILQSYKLGTKATDTSGLQAGKFPFYEILSSFIVELQDIARQFMKQLHDVINRDLISIDVFQLPVDEKTSLITKKINDGISSVLLLIINDRENIYYKLNYKYMLLNFS